MMGRIKLYLLFSIPIFFVACGYIPVRNPVTLSGSGYENQSFDNSNSLRLLVWNIHAENESSEWERDLKNIVSANSPDIILLQEIRITEDTENFLSNKLKYGWEFSPNLYQAKFDAYSGVATASKTKPIKSFSILSNGLEPISNTPKTTLFTTYLLGNSAEKVLVINNHGINFQLTPDKFKEQIRLVAEHIKRHIGPIILAGDFNTWNDVRLQHLGNVTNSLGLVPVIFPAGVKAIFGNPIDHIYYSKNSLKLIGGTEQAVTNVASSDHKPLFVILEYISPNPLTIKSSRP